MKIILLKKTGLWVLLFMLGPINLINGMDDSYKAAKAALEQSLRFRRPTETTPITPEKKPKSPTTTEQQEQARLIGTIQARDPLYGAPKKVKEPQPTTPKFKVPFEQEREVTKKEAEDNFVRTNTQLKAEKRELETLGGKLQEAIKKGNTEEANRLSTEIREKQFKIQETESLLKKYEELLGGKAAAERYRKSSEAAAHLRSRFGQEVSGTARPTFMTKLKEAKETVDYSGLRDLFDESKIPPKATQEEVGNALKEMSTQARDTQSFLQRNRKALAIGLGVGAGIIGLTGLIGVLVAVLTEDKEKEEDKQTTPDTTPIQPTPEPVKPIEPPAIDQGTVTPSVYPPASYGDQEYEEKILPVTEFFSDIENKFKDTLESTSYFDTEFKLEGSITIGKTTEKIGVAYKFENELGTPFTPFLITLYPQDISGYELNTIQLIEQIQDGPAKELLSMLLKPKASFVFIIKTILLINTAMRDETKKDVEKIEFILSEINKLYSKLILTPGINPTPASLFAEMPETIRNILSKKLVKMYSELLFSFRDSENSPFIEKLSQMRQIKGYKQKTSYVTSKIIPLIQKNLTYTEKKYLLHALSRHLSDIPKTVKDLTKNTKDLKTMLTKVIQAMNQSGMEQSTIDTVTKILTNLKTVKTIKTPEFEISNIVYKDAIPLPDVMDVLFAHFSTIQNTSFSGDPDYLFFDFNLGKNATKYKLEAILFRCMAETLKAEQILCKNNKTINLRHPTGSTKAINPEQEFNNMCKKASQDFIKSQTKLSEAAKQLRNDTKNALFKKAYDEAFTELNKVSKSLYDNQIKFRRTFAVYYPLTQSDGSTRTPYEFIKKELATLKKYSKHVDNLIKEEYAPFNTHFGFNIEDLLEQKKTTKK